MSIASRIRHTWKRGLIVATLLRWLSRLGIQVVPYYLGLETIKGLDQAGFRPDLDEPFEFVFLTRDDIQFIEGPENAPATFELFSTLWNAGCSCFGLKSGEKILAYGWLDLNKCNYEFYDFELQPNEAYIFGFFTAKNVRGKNLAPALRCYIHKYLINKGIDKIYSITEVFNTPALRHKMKFNYNITELFIHVRLFGVLSKNIHCF